MPVNLSVKNVPDGLAERLRERAASNHRSLQRELMSILEQAVSAVPAPLEGRASVPSAIGQRPVEEVLAELRRIFPEPRHGGPSSVDLVRRMRDARQADAKPAASPRRGSRQP